MFDARSLLEQLVRGGAQPQRAAEAQGGLGGLGDILGQLGQAMGQPGARGASPGAAGGGGLGDILGRLGEAMGQQGRQVAPSTDNRGAQGGGGLEEILKNMLPGAGGSADGSGRAAAPAGQAGGGGLGDILGRIQEGLGKQGGSPGQGGGGGLADILGQILGTAKDGVREGAGRIDDATGASGQMRDAIGKATGKSPDEILAQLKDLIQNNQLGAGAVAGGLGSILLGTRTGRSIAMNAAKLGALALIGGLAYKALQNYQQGRPVLSGGSGDPLTEAPRGSGFESGAVTHNSAQLYIRGMIAAAAADGRIDEGEQKKILGSLKQGGLDAGAEEFLGRELNSPATADSLAQAVSTEAEAVQLYTAARIAIDLDTAEEHEFLAALAQSLGIDESLASHIDAQARAAA